MTIGEKIKAYREELGITVDELGARLDADTKTVELWERGELQPTFAELKKLKEAFDITMDELFGDNDEIKIALEHYKFRLAEEEIIKLQKALLGDWLMTRFGFMLLYVALIIVFFIIHMDMTVIMFALTLLIFEFVGILSKWRSQLKAIQKSAKLLSGDTMEYRVYDEGFDYWRYHDREKCTFSRIPFSAVNIVVEKSELIAISANGNLFSVRKSEIKPDSLLLTKAKKVKRIPMLAMKRGWIKAITVALAAASIAALAAAQFVMAGYLFNPIRLWTLLLLLLLPAASIAWAIYLRKCGEGYKTNFIVGIIASALLLMILAAAISFRNATDTIRRDDRPIKRAEQLINIDLPESSMIATIDRSDDQCKTALEEDHYFSTVSLNEAEAKQMERIIQNDERWLDEMPSVMLGIAYGASFQDYTLICNTETGEFNTLPNESGSYHFIMLSYSAKTKMLTIVEYDKNYVK